MTEQTEINKPHKPLQPGKRMLAAWDYIDAHPWCSEAMIRINYGQQTLNRLIAHHMIDVRQGRHDRQLHAIEWDSRPADADADAGTGRRSGSDLRTAVDRLQTSTSLQSVPCPMCQAPPGLPCRSRRTHAACKLHPERITVWAAKIIAKYGELDLSE
jgi:hypothetical protein